MKFIFKLNFDTIHLLNEKRTGNNRRRNGRTDSNVSVKVFFREAT